MRGEYSVEAANHLTDEGSPPLAWGILIGEGDHTEFVGITPTCVGNTKQTLRSRLEFRDHPHLRGEYSVTTIKYKEEMGSPPLAWGIPICLSD